MFDGIIRERFSSNQSVVHQSNLAANKIEDADQQRGLLLKICGTATHQFIQSLHSITYRKLAELKITELMEGIQKYVLQSQTCVE